MHVFCSSKCNALAQSDPCMSEWLTTYRICAGLYVEGMEGREEDVAALERRWLKPIYTAAPKLVLRYAKFTKL